MKKILFILVFAAYLAILLKITVFRSSFGDMALFENGTLNLVPFLNLIKLLQKRQFWQFIYLFAGNIIWFMPLGIFAPLISRKTGLFQTVSAGFLLSFAIELMQ